MDEDPADKKRRLAKERQQRWKARQTPENLQRIRRENAHAHRLRYESQSPQQLQQHRDSDAEAHRLRRELESPEQLQQRRDSDAEAHRLRRELESPEQSQQRRDSDAEAHCLRRELELLEQSQQRRDSDAEAHRLRHELESPEQCQQRRDANAASHRLQYELNRQLESQTIRDAARNIFLDDSGVELHTCGQLNKICDFCGSKNFLAELPSDKKFTTCCRKGKVKLPKPMDENGVELLYPDFLRSLLCKTTNPHFREHIRSYNNAVSFASMGAKIVDLPNRGPYVFKVHGQTYHKTSHIEPVDASRPQYAQLYVFDSTQATSLRQDHPANQNCQATILNQIDRFFRQHNRIAQSYQMMKEIEAEETRKAIERGETIPVVNMAFRRDRRSDQRRYNAPNSNEVAMVFVNDDGEPPFDRDIRIYPRNPSVPNQPFVNINILSPNMDPMCYSLLFPYGEPGWQPNWECETYDGVHMNQVRNKISMLQYKAALTAIRGPFNPIMSAGKLTQQWLVDSYLQVEANNLNYVRQNQQKLRAEQYQGLADHVANLAENLNIAAGTAVILPSSFEGSPRNMRERCNDAMAIFAKWGAPDLFVTFTANPTWPEITENLNSWEQVSDRPDLVARVFRIKLKSLMDDLTVHGIFGKSIAHVYTIEFQKRGLPHAHILITVAAEYKFATAEQIDRFVTAEIPDPIHHPRLHEIVKRCMMHGPCGANGPQAPCMENGMCKKQFPKDFRNETIPNRDGYPLYRRRDNIEVQVRGSTLDNRHVVPYNPYLLLKYNAHINVEICTSLRAVKYIYKYIFKGFDCANIAITSDGQRQFQFDEVTNFVDARYLSAPEAMWRLLEFKMHDRSHAVIRLPVHEPNKQRVYFEAGREEEALLAAQTGKTKLESWFQLNLTDEDARNLLYTEIPHHYVYARGNWQKRQRGGGQIIARMYTVSPKDEERFYLRLLLLHVLGATSFEFLRTYNGVAYNNFKEAAAARGLLDSDEEWDRCLTEASTYQMPKQLRDTFAFICCFCQPSNPLDLWNKFSEQMSLDYARRYDRDSAINLSLHDIEVVLNQHGLSCAAIKLPIPTGLPTEEEIFDPIAEAEIANNCIGMLNQKQKEAFDKIVFAVDHPDEEERCFYLDGPGGSGKTFLYSTLMSYFRGRSQSVLPFATTGIASTLLKGGRTAHSGFKLPVPLLDTSVSSIRPSSKDADPLRKASLLLIDEITMLSKHGLSCIDKLLREIMAVNKPFGGKVLVIGGDFRQTLPVVPRGSQTDIVEICIKSSRLWQHFTPLSLTTNMRSDGFTDHNEWLLKVGKGDIAGEGLPYSDAVEIPAEMIEPEDIIKSTFGENVEQLPLEELAKRVILSPTNEQTLEINRKIIDQLPGDPHIYYSADSVISEDPNDALNYPAEFLHYQTPSGMPPHVLVLKKGVVIMLLRNLNPKKGLCNGTRMIVRNLHRNFISAEIISECHRGDLVFIPRIDLAPSDTTLPFVLKRRQFPVTPAYAITINKSQGQTYEFVGVNLKTPVFSHGQLYVALSRCRNPNNVKVFIKPNQVQGNLLQDGRVFTRNVVFKEIFRM